MDTFICWDPEGEDEPVAGDNRNTIEAIDAEDAAEEYAEALYGICDHFDEVDIHVRSQNGALSVVEVAVDWNPSFVSRGKKAPGAAPEEQGLDCGLCGKPSGNTDTCVPCMRRVLAMEQARRNAEVD